MNRRVSVTKKMRSPDGHGGWKYTDSPVGIVWASIQPVSATERVRFGNIASEADTAIYMRYPAPVNANCTILLGSREFSVRGVVEPIDRKKYVVILATENKS